MTTLSCPAKINLFLRVGNKIGAFHEIETVLLRTDKLEDMLTFEEAEIFSFEVTGKYKVPADDSNTVIKAIHLLEKIAAKKFTYKITLEKNIPPCSGLGGGSSDAASTLIFLNEKENLQIPHRELMKIAAQIGMDVPFFLSGFPVALGTHFGEALEELPELPPEIDFEIHFSGLEISTKEAYEKLDEIRSSSQKLGSTNSSVIHIISAIKAQNSSAILENLHNDFEQILPYFSNTAFIPLFQNTSSEKALLSGSGGAFVVFHLKNTHK